MNILGNKYHGQNISQIKLPVYFNRNIKPKRDSIVKGFMKASMRRWSERKFFIIKKQNQCILKSIIIKMLPWIFQNQ